MNVSDSIQVPSGVLLIDKARDMTSHDVVAIARRSLGIKKIGHCGTLDPMATGLLMLVVGKATKLQDKLMCEHKEYAGTLMLGVETSSQDAMGEIVAEYSVDGVTEQAVREAFDRFDGAFEQIPPMVSAIKKDGVPLYKLARKGQEIVREPSGNICSPGACRHGEHHHERRCGPFNQDGRTGGHYEFCLVGQAHHPQENRLQRA